MGTSWFVRPETDRLVLSEGQWLIVRKRLSTGEYRAHLKRSSYVDAVGIRRVDTLLQGLSTVVAYLVDWSLEAEILGASESDLIAALDNLAPDRFAEIKAAIEAHEAAMTAQRDDEKKTMTAGATPSSAT